ncbi:hypothetical protein F7725_007391 [Dissostichus mawsoni]|uniref:Uncharacterized protein n=1 Tax=Dissostichus mawsoni TaxID=36200 RepID=A0A7J5XYB1_DISMA|nr:hypothetical protein F7725_007391 [Dissostichus mawsoni]
MTQEGRDELASLLKKRLADPGNRTNAPQGLMTPWRTMTKTVTSVMTVRKTLMRTSHTPYPHLEEGRWGTAPLSPTLPPP